MALLFRINKRSQPVFHRLLSTVGNCSSASASTTTTSTGSSPGRPWKHFILQYNYVENMLDRRTPHRTAHLHFASQFLATAAAATAANTSVSVAKEVQLIAGGALLPEVVSGVLLFRAADKQLVEDFARRDPYVTAGLVTKFHVSEWAVAIGEV